MMVVEVVKRGLWNTLKVRMGGLFVSYKVWEKVESLSN